MCVILYVTAFLLVNIHPYSGKVCRTVKMRILREEKGLPSLVLPGCQEAIPSKLHNKHGTFSCTCIFLLAGFLAHNEPWLNFIIVRARQPEEKKSKKKKRKKEQQDKAAPRDEDIVEDLVLSSDEDDGLLSDTSAESDGNENVKPVRKQTQKPKVPSRGSKKNTHSPANKAKKRKTSR